MDGRGRMEAWKGKEGRKGGTGNGVGQALVIIRGWWWGAIIVHACHCRWGGVHTHHHSRWWLVVHLWAAVHTHCHCLDGWCEALVAIDGVVLWAVVLICVGSGCGQLLWCMSLWLVVVVWGQLSPCLSSLAWAVIVAGGGMTVGGCCGHLLFGCREWHWLG